jgi:hypothetical protein
MSDRGSPGGSSLLATLAQLGEDLLNNKGVAAKETDHRADYRPDDQSVWGRAR